MSLGWLRAIRRSMEAAATPGVEPKQRPLSIGIGYCPGCEHLRATNSLSCNYCGSAAPVVADA